MSKRSVSLSLTEENVEWLDNRGYNRSGYIDDLLTEARGAGSETEQVIARYRKEQLEMEKRKLESQMEGVTQQLEQIDGRVQTQEERREEKLQEAIEAIDKVPKHHLDEDNQAVINRAEELNITPEELLEEYRDRTD